MKEKIKSSFDAASRTYDSVSEVQTLSSAYLVDMLKRLTLPGKIDKILDIGSGTGNTSLELMKIYPSSNYTLCDISKNMIHNARLKIKNANHILCDAEQYNFTEQYDVVVSNLAVQWFESIDLFMGKILKNCRCFAFSTLLDKSFHNYKELHPCYDGSVPNFLSAKEIKHICRKHGFLIKQKIKKYSLLFENPFGLARYFKKLGASAYRQEGNIISSMGGHKIKLDYWIFFGIIKNENSPSCI
ncbi:MAG: methyltransferase domain-containing protein [Holosporaceae bacterium]|jgi:malonyl-ACP O-methyltransferase BioC|nr:methyltransferase domain-containing protein [Holosporaceae bacterium]